LIVLITIINFANPALEKKVAVFGYCSQISR